MKLTHLLTAISVAVGTVVACDDEKDEDTSCPGPGSGTSGGTSGKEDDGNTRSVGRDCKTTGTSGGPGVGTSGSVGASSGIPTVGGTSTTSSASSTAGGPIGGTTTSSSGLIGTSGGM